MTITLTVQQTPNGIALPDLTPRLTRASFSTNLHGDEALSISSQISLPRAFARYDRAGAPHAIVTDGASTPFQGRIEDTTVHNTGLDLTAFGYQRALSDARYTALWTITKVGDFRPVISTEIATATPDRYTFDTNNRVYIAPQKNATFGTTVAAKQAYMCYIPPDDGTRDIIGAQFDFVFTAPAANWRAILITQNANFTTIATPWLLVAVAGGTTTGSINVTFAAAKIVSFFMDFNAADAVYAGETGANFLRITNVRLVTSTTNRINTTTTAAITAGANVNIPVVSSARMYVGQRLFLDTTPIGGTTTSSAIVTVVPDSTHVTIDTLTFTAGAGGVAVRAMVIYADEIVKDIVSAVSTLNSTQLLTDTTQVTSPSLDLLDQVYEDAIPAAVLDHLITLGDNAAIPNQWEWGVTGLRVLYFRVAGAAAQTWYVDVTGITVQRTLSTLANSVYAVYQDASNRTLRGPASSDSASISQFALTRTQAVTATTTSQTQANVLRDATLADDSDPAPRFSITFSAVYNAVGGRVPLWMPRAGDTLVIRNLPPTISVDIDQIRTFRIARTTCDLVARTLTIEPLTPLPSVQALLAQQAH